MEGLEKLRWARYLIAEKTEGRQTLVAGWDGMPSVQIRKDCMAGLYFSLLKNQETGLYDCRVKGYIRTCGGYQTSTRMTELAEECARIADLVAELEQAGIHVEEAQMKVFCEELKRQEKPRTEEGAVDF